MNNNNSTNDFKKFLDLNYIRLSKTGKSYRCLACNTILFDFNIEKHTKNYQHQNFLIRLKRENLQISSKSSALFINVRYCRQCQEYLIDDEIFRYHCLMHFYEIYNKYIIYSDIVEFNFHNEGKILINCRLCNIELVDEKILILHVKSNHHTNRLNLISNIELPKITKDDSENYETNSNFIVSEYSNKFYITVQYCVLCQQKILENNIFEHIKWNDHSQLLNLSTEDISETKINFSNAYMCFMCNKAYSNQKDFLQHFNSKEHVYISRNFYQILKSDHVIIKTFANKEIFYCKVCNQDLLDISMAIKHMESLKHSLKVKNFNINNRIVSNVSTSVLRPVSAENKVDSTSDPYDNLDTLLNELLPHDLSRKIMFNNNKKGKPHLQRHFNKNLNNFATDYVEMCIVPGEKNIYCVELSLEASINMNYQMKNPWYYAQVFFCTICRIRIEFELDFIIHLLSETHKKLIRLKKNENAKFHICPICVTYWYGKADEFDKHCEEISHKRCLNSNEFFVPKLSKIVVDQLIEVDTNIKNLLHESNKTYHDKPTRELELLKSIETVAQAAYPQAKAYIFGSRLSYLGFPDSDVDIFLDCENVYYDMSSSSNRSTEYLETVKNLLSQQNNWIIEEILLRARVPILKLKHIDTSLKCDISFLNGLGVEKSKLIRHFNEAYPICRLLILFIKKWLKNCRLLGANAITTYAASWFVIFYLQNKNILPSIYSLLGTNQEKFVEGWNCSFSDNIPVATPDLTFNNHLKNFFLFYADFDYQSNVICPLLGKTIKKSSFSRSSKLPHEMNVYKKRLISGEIELFRIDSPMCIQDPVDLSQNMTKAVPKLLLRYFIEYCTVSAQYLKTQI